MVDIINFGNAELPRSGEDGLHDRGEAVGTASFSLDPFAGQTYADKPIWDVPTIAENLNRSEWDWYTNNNGVLNDGVLNFAFWNSADDFFGTGYINDTETIAYNEFFYFEAMNDTQRTAAREAIGVWDDLVSISFVETDVASADIRYGNTDTGGAQAYAYLPFGTIFDEPAGGFSNNQDLGGDVWVDYNVASNFFPIEDSYYSVITLIHETGHALGLSHPGDYDALDDNDGDGVPDPITYGNDAFYAQDSLQYSVMSYFDGYETGAQMIDWSLLNFAYAATPLVHDIAAIQEIYGADLTTRTGDTVYGFNSTADRDAYNFDLNSRPIVAVYDAGGTDTIDFSGWDTDSIINLNEGAFSSGGGIEEFLTLEEINANRAALGFAARSQATFDLYNQLFKDQFGLTDGLFHDNISIAYGTVIENAVGGAGDDLIIANQVANRIDGGAGNDTVSYETATSGVFANLLVPFGNLYGAAGDRLISIENLTGSKYDDALIGDFGDNILDGGKGGLDTLIGGFGNDTVSYANADGLVKINLATNVLGGRAVGDIISGFENAIGGTFGDALTGTNGSNILDGGAGNDRIDGADGNDTLIGGAGNDILSGGGGNDKLYDGLGQDALTGGTGRDIFYFAAIDGSLDRITDFAKGQDIVDLSGIDAIAHTDADDAFAYLGSGLFTGVAGQLRYVSNTLQGDVDGDGVADFRIKLNISNIAVADLVL